MDRPLPNSYWVLPGRFLAGEYPASGGKRGAEERLGGLLAAGIDLFIDLTEPDESPAYEMLLLTARDAAERGDLAGLTLAGERAIALDPRRFEAYGGVGMLLAKSAQEG